MDDNNRRYQWGLKKMTPAQYLGHKLTVWPFS
ncbi:hypothetical protein [Bacillus swezeyi]